MTLVYAPRTTTTEVFADGASISVCPPITRLNGKDTLLTVTQFPHTTGTPTISIHLTPAQLTRLIDSLVDAHIATKAVR